MIFMMEAWPNPPLEQELQHSKLNTTLSGSTSAMSLRSCSKTGRLEAEEAAEEEEEEEEEEVVEAVVVAATAVVVEAVAVTVVVVLVATDEVVAVVVEAEPTPELRATSFFSSPAAEVAFCGVAASLSLTDCKEFKGTAHTAMRVPSGLCWATCAYISS
jgi:hypothetical protein